mmetsp:Transcript_1213/g.3515  ORF Transcript_1213/g.3515 Transcript_1213/m.3515 type:complete len:261 (+) Transcript_1213:1059-1841(+)
MGFEDTPQNNGVTYRSLGRASANSKEQHLRQVAARSSPEVPPSSPRTACRVPPSPCTSGWRPAPPCLPVDGGAAAAAADIAAFSGLRMVRAPGPGQQPAGVSHYWIHRKYAMAAPAVILVTAEAGGGVADAADVFDVRARMLVHYKAASVALARSSSPHLAVLGRQWGATPRGPLAAASPWSVAGPPLQSTGEGWGMSRRPGLPACWAAPPLHWHELLSRAALRACQARVHAGCAAACASPQASSPRTFAGAASALAAGC